MAAIGIAVRRSEAHGVLARGGRVVSYGHVSLAPGETVGDAVTRLIAALATRRSRPRVTVAVGLAHCQLKRIDGLPALSGRKSGKVLTRIVRENSGSFFLRTGGGIVVSDVRRDAGGASWAAAFDAALVEHVLGALRTLRLPRAALVPSIVARGKLLGAGQHLYIEDGLAVEVTIAARGDVELVRRVACTDACAADIPPAVAELDEEYLDAYAAAVAPRGLPFAWCPEPDARHTRLAELVRLAAASVLFALAASASVLAPGLRARGAAARASAELDAAGSAQVEASRVEGELIRVNAQLARIGRFTAQRGNMTLLLGAIAQAIPESTALVTLRVDSLEGSFVALSTHAADVLAQLAAADPLVNPRIVGSVTREVQGTARLERATIRFRRQRPRADR